MRLNPAVPEVRAQRVALARLVAALGIPTEERVPLSPERAERQRLRNWLVERHQEQRAVRRRLCGFTSGLSR